MHKAVAHGAREADGEQDEVCLYLEVRALFGDGLAVGGALGLDGVHLSDVAACTREAFDGDGEAALAALLVGWVGVQDEGPVRPGEVVGGVRRAGTVGQNLDRGAALTVGVAETVRARVAAAQDDGVELALEVLRGRTLANVGVGTELDPFLLHDGDAAVDYPLFDLVVGDAVSEEATDPIVLLEHDGRVSCPIELLRRGEPGGPATDDGDLPACTLLRRCRPGDDPSFFKGPVDDGELYLLYGDGLVVDGEDARGLARGRAEHPRELGEVVGLVQAVYGLLPVLAVDEIVPVGDQVPQGAACVAERHAAVHAARGLALELLVGHRLVDVAIVLDALLDCPLRGRLASDLEEALRVPH